MIPHRDRPNWLLPTFAVLVLAMCALGVVWLLSPKPQINGGYVEVRGAKQRFSKANFQLEGGEPFQVQVVAFRQQGGERHELAKQTLVINQRIDFEVNRTDAGLVCVMEVSGEGPRELFAASLPGADVPEETIDNIGALAPFTLDTAQPVEASWTYRRKTPANSGNVGDADIDQGRVDEGQFDEIHVELLISPLVGG